jgi:hypothetical protein
VSMCGGVFFASSCSLTGRSRKNAHELVADIGEIEESGIESIRWPKLHGRGRRNDGCGGCGRIHRAPGFSTSPDLKSYR